MFCYTFAVSAPGADMYSLTCTGNKCKAKSAETNGSKSLFWLILHEIGRLPCWKRAIYIALCVCCYFWSIEDLTRVVILN